MEELAGQGDMGSGKGIRQSQELCWGPGLPSFSGLGLHLTCLLPHSLEGPPSYKPPTPKAKLEEPEMVSPPPGTPSCPTVPPTFPHSGRGWEGGLTGEADCEGVLTRPSLSRYSLPSSSRWGPRSTARSRLPTLMLAPHALNR